MTFNTAKLVFDREPTIESQIFKSLSDDYTNFIFKDSKDDRLLQLSDVIVGFASKLSTYVENNPVERLIQDIMAMNEQQKENLRLWFDIENKSEDLCKILLHQMQPSSARDKMFNLEQRVYLPSQKFWFPTL